MNRNQFVGLAVLALQFGCGGDSPTVVSEGAQVAPPAPVVAATATPAPTATAIPAGFCANGERKVARFDIKVFSVIDKNGEIREWNGGPIYVGETIRFDSQGHPVNGGRTNGCSENGPRWDWIPTELVQWSADFSWNPRAKVLAPGLFTAWAEMDGVDADFKLILNFQP